jgi:hypothetical protein
MRFIPQSLEKKKRILVEYFYILVSLTTIALFIYGACEQSVILICISLGILYAAIFLGWLFSRIYDRYAFLNEPLINV